MLVPSAFLASAADSSGLSLNIYNTLTYVLPNPQLYSLWQQAHSEDW